MSDASSIAALEQLLPDLFDGTLDGAGRERLNTLLAADTQARALYLEYCQMHAMLRWQHGTMPVAESAAPRPIVKLPARRATIQRLVAAVALAALVALAVLLSPAQTDRQNAEEVAEIRTDEFVARITGLKDCVWAAQTDALQLGSDVRHGQHLHLTSGFAEVTFSSGAQVVLEGPALFDAANSWEATLHRGTLRATVPEQAQGFRISSQIVDVVDLGTEFSMSADDDGETEVFVLQGAVEVAPKENARSAEPKVLLREKEARRFGRKGMGKVADSERKLKRFLQRVQFERSENRAGVVHWSFDQLDGRALKVGLHNLSGASIAAELESDAPAGLIEGRFNRALHFDGGSFIRTGLPPEGNHLPKTIAFWVRVPENSSLSSNNSILTWNRRDGAKPRKAGRALRVTWNQNPAQGALGAVRTEIGKNFVVGSAPIRDGRWHHVAIVLRPGAGVDGPVQINHYIDGRLENLAPLRGKARKGAAFEGDASSVGGAKGNDVLTLGRGGNQGRPDFFEGDLDELYVFDRALSQQELAQLMQHNRIAPDTKE